MKKHGFTLIELILSIVLVTIIIVTMVGTLLKIRESYSIINQNIEARTYKALIAKVINEHFMKNGGVKNINCLSNTKCELLLGNNKTMTLEIIENDIKTEEVKDSTNNVVATRKIQTSTLKYYGNQYNYLKTLKSVKTTYVNSDVIIDGYAFKKITSNVYEYINVKNSELKDTITNIIIETSDPNYNIELYSTAIVDKDEFKRLYTLTYNNNGGSGCYKTVAKDGEYWGTTENPLCVPNVSPVGYSFYGWFNQPSRGNEILNNVTRANGNITAYAQWTNKRFSCPSGQYLPKNSMSCEECLEDNYCSGVTDKLFDKFEDQGIIPCDSGYSSESGGTSANDCKITCSANTYLANANNTNCTNCATGYISASHQVIQGNTSSCTAAIYTVTLDQQGGSGGTTSVNITYGTTQGNYPSITLPTKSGYAFDGYYTGTNGGGTQYYNKNGNSVRTWDIASDTTLYAKWKISCASNHTYNSSTGKCEYPATISRIYCYRDASFSGYDGGCDCEYEDINGMTRYFSVSCQASGCAAACAASHAGATGGGDCKPKYTCSSGVQSGYACYDYWDNQNYCPYPWSINTYYGTNGYDYTCPEGGSPSGSKCIYTP